MRALILLSALSLALAGPALAKPCHGANGKFVKCAPATVAPAKTPALAAPMAPAATPAMTPIPSGHPQCKKGKPCGNSCIAMAKVCHKG